MAAYNFLSRAARMARLLTGCALFAALTTAAVAQTNIIQTFLPKNPVIPGAPVGITFGPDNAFWFCENQGNAIGRIDTVSNIITEISLSPTIVEGPFGIVVGSDSNLWFTEANGNNIGRMSVNSNFVTFPLATPNTYPFVMTVGPDNNIWFVEFNQNKIAAFNPLSPTNANGTVKLVHEYGPFGTSTRFGSPGTNAEIYGLTVGPDANIWFTQASYGTIGKLNPATGVSNLFQLSASNSQPLSIVGGPDGALWFTELNSNVVGRIPINATSGTNVTTFPLPANALTALPEPYDIILGNDNNLWFTEFTGSAVGRITPTGNVTIFPTPSQPGVPTFMATGPSSGTGASTNIWFGGYPSSQFGSGTINDTVDQLVINEALNLSVMSPVSVPSNIFSGTLATFQNSNSNNLVVVNWGDGTGDAVQITSASRFASETNVVVFNKVSFTNSLSITNTIPVATNGLNGQFSILATHTFVGSSNSFNVTVSVTDAGNDFASASILLQTGLAPVAVPLTITTTSSSFIVKWPGSSFNLLSAPAPSGPWSMVPGAASPFTSPLTNSMKFFRLRSQ